MKSVLFVFSLFLLFFECNIEAATKQDILDFVDIQKVGNSETETVFNSYKTTFTRLLKQKELTASQCDEILSDLQLAVRMLNEKGINKISDLDKLTVQEKNTIYNYLISGANIITNAPIVESTIGKDGIGNSNKSNTSNTTVSINASEGTIEIYEGGVLIDKVSNATSRFTYTGPSKVKVKIIVSSGVLFVASLLIYLVLAGREKTKKTSMIKNFIVALNSSSIMILVIAVGFNRYITMAEDILAMVRVNESTEIRNVELDNNNEIKIYPSYGNNYAKLSIDNLNIEKAIVFGEDSNLLSKNICQATWSDFPTEGNVTVLSGHNKENMLKNIENIAVGEKIVIDATYAKCTYEVYKTAIVEETDNEALNKDMDKETVIIYTCYPFSEYVYGSKRFVVYAALIDVNWK